MSTEYAMTPESAPPFGASGAGRWLPRAPRNHDFDLVVREEASTLLLEVAGEFDLAAVGRVEVALDRQSASCRKVVFDLREVTFIDLAGLMTVIRADQRSRDAMFDVRVVAPRGLARRVFTLTRAGAQLNMLDDLPDLQN